MQLLRHALKLSISAHEFYILSLEVIVLRASNTKGCSDVSIDHAIVLIDTWNQWNEFNDDYQINDLSRTHAHRTSTSCRHRRTLNRTLMHSVINRRFIVLPHTSMFHHEPFSHGYLRAIVIRRASHSNSAIRKVSIVIAQYSLQYSRYFIKLSQDNRFG